MQLDKLFYFLYYPSSNLVLFFSDQKQKGLNLEKLNTILSGNNHIWAPA